MKILTFILSLSICLCKININNPNIELMRDIPIDDTKIDAIIDYIDYSNGIDNIYELLEIDQINAATKNLKAGDADDKEFERRMKVTDKLLQERKLNLDAAIRADTADTNRARQQPTENLPN